MTDTTGPWRKPNAETEDYPGLWVHDGRVTGSITIDRSRLPLWAIIGEYAANGWDGVLNGWDYIEDDYGFTHESFASFLYYLLEARGEFGRLVLAIANAERAERHRDLDFIETHFAEAHPNDNVCTCMPEHPPAWWGDPELSAPVVDLLRRCLAALGERDD